MSARLSRRQRRLIATVVDQLADPNRRHLVLTRGEIRTLRKAVASDHPDAPSAHTPAAVASLAGLPIVVRRRWRAA